MVLMKEIKPIYNRTDSSGKPIAPRLASITVKPIKTKRSKKKIVLFSILGVIVLALALGFWQFQKFSNKVFVSEKSGLLDQLKDAIAGATGQTELIGEKSGQINVLLLGIGGPGHDGPYLTDTIIVAQIRPKDGQVSMVSLPRDYLANLGNFGLRKINAAFAEEYNRTKSIDQAGLYARQKIGEISGLDIPYFAVVDFTGFEKAIDAVGGVKVTIDKTFTDSQYPDNSLGYIAPVTFKAGDEVMNGKRALIFARSRHGSNGEGSDFARSQRQQKVIKGFRAKAVSSTLLTNPGSVSRLLDIFADHFHTNFTPGELWHLYTTVKDFEDSNLTAMPLDEATGIICPEIAEETGAYILVPCAGKTRDDVKAFFRESFLLGALNQEKATIWLASPNPKTLRSTRLEKYFTALGLKVLPVTYDTIKPAQSIVYQVNPKPKTADFLTRELKATEASIPPPGLALSPSKLDIVIILGTDLE